MNGKYVIYYALILAAMACLLVVGLFDGRLLNGKTPSQATNSNRMPYPAKPVINPDPPRSKINDRRLLNPNNSRRTDSGSKTNLHGVSLENRLTPMRAANRDSGFIFTEDECAERQGMHHEGGMVEKKTAP